MDKTLLGVLLIALVAGCTKDVEVKSPEFYTKNQAERAARMATCKTIMEQKIKTPADLVTFNNTNEGKDCENAAQSYQKQVLTIKDPSKGRTYLKF